MAVAQGKLSLSGVPIESIPLKLTRIIRMHMLHLIHTTIIVVDACGAS